MREIILASRGSRLAMTQANMVASSIRAAGRQVRIIEVSTKGDRDRVSPITAIGGRGLFVTEIEQYLLDGRADIAVHSGKDLPYELKEGLLAAGIPTAADPRDCLISRKGEKVPENAVIGTGSPRRITECSKYYPHANYRSIRGNIDTRLEKLRSGEYDAIILAKAGLDRLGEDLSDFDVRAFSTDEFLPSACQGILAAECRENDSEIRALLKSISDPVSARRFEVERYMLNLMRADCSVPLGVYAEIFGDELKITAMFHGKKVTQSGSFSDYTSLCLDVRRRFDE